MVDYLIQKVTDIIINHWRRVLILTAILVVVIFLLRFFFSIAFIEVEVDSSQVGTNIPVRVFSNTETNQTEIGKTGLHIVSRDTKSILATTGNNIRTQSMLDIPWYGYVHKKITLHRDKNADKIAFNSTLDNPCAAYNKSIDRLMQYDCDNPQALVYYNTPQDKTWSIETVLGDIFYSQKPKPYKDGLLGIAYTGASEGDVLPVLAIDSGGKRHYYQRPVNFDMSLIDSSSIFTDTTNQENNRFVIVEKNGTIHLSAPKQDPNDPGIDYTTIPAPAGYNSTLEQTMCNLKETAVICYRGLATNIGDTTEDTDKIQPQIIKMTFGSDKPTITTLNDRSLFFEFAVTNDGQLYGLNYKKLVRFEQKDGIYVAQELSQNVDDIAAASDKLYFVQNNGIFTVDPASHDAYQIFYSHNIQPDKLFSSAGHVFILGKSVNNNGATYAWRLNDVDNVSYGTRLIDILPSFPASSAYGTTDLVNNMIYIEVKTARDATASDIRRKKQATLGYLKDLGVNLDQVTITNF